MGTVIIMAALLRSPRMLVLLGGFLSFAMLISTGWWLMQTYGAVLWTNFPLTWPTHWALHLQPSLRFW